MVKAKEVKTQDASIEDQIKKLKAEFEAKIKELQSNLTWESKFKAVFNNYVKHGTISNMLNGYRPESMYINDINNHLLESKLSVKFNSSNFDNDLHNHTPSVFDSCDLSEYPVFLVLDVLDSLDKVLGHVKIEGNYSSYNGKEFSHWYFATEKEITCKMYVSV